MRGSALVLRDKGHEEMGERWILGGVDVVSPSQQGPSTPQSFKPPSPMTFTPAKSLGIPAWRPSPCQISALRKGDKQ